MSNGMFLPALQFIIAGLVMGSAPLVPPRQGDILLLPLVSSPRHDLVQNAMAVGAILTGAGRLAGSVVVRGDRASLLREFIPRGVLVLSAPDLLCEGNGSAVQ
jgi:hypothetical protein